MTVVSRSHSSADAARGLPPRKGGKRRRDDDPGSSSSSTWDHPQKENMCAVEQDSHGSQQIPTRVAAGADGGLGRPTGGDLRDPHVPEEEEEDASVEFLYHRAPASSHAQGNEPRNLIEPTVCDSNNNIDDESRSIARDQDTKPLEAHSPRPTRESTDAPTRTTTTEGAPSTHLPPSTITPLTSAYLQNLAELCYTILSDQRWRVGCRNEPLFRWEHGDDLSVVLALARRYLGQPTDERVTDGEPWSSLEWQCQCLLCQSAEAAPMPSSDASDTANRRNDPNGSEEVDMGPQRCVKEIKEEEDDRCLHLYCRLFYRKGPWFRLDDLFKKYYGPKKNHPGTQRSIDSSVMDSCLGSLQDMLDDVTRLYEKGFIRGFQSEKECGLAVDKTLLTNMERGQVLHHMAAGSRRGRILPCQPGTAILRQMKGQRQLFPGSSTAFLPVRRHVKSVVCQSLARTILRWSYPHRDPTAAEVHHWEGRIQHSVGTTAAAHVLAGFCLRAEPQRTLARCARLYLCATCGPGNMRGDGTNGWKSLTEISGPKHISGVPVPGIHAWHTVEYPGLKARFGLCSFPFHQCFDFMPVSGDKEAPRVFDSYDDFVALEWAIELRAHVDFILELENILRYHERRAARADSIAADGGESITLGDIDFLGVTTLSGRRKMLRKVSMQMNGLEESVVRDMERDLQQLHSEPHLTICQKVLSAIGVLAYQVLRYRNLCIQPIELTRKTRRPWLRHLWWDGNLAYILWDIIPTLEKIDHLIAARALETLLFGRPVTNGVFSVIPVIGHTHKLAAILLSRRTRGKAFARLSVDYRHILKRARLAVRDDAAALLDLKQRQSDSIHRFFESTVVDTIIAGSIPFSAIRELAKPMKRPLANLLFGVSCHEAEELGLRLEVESTTARADRYSEWAPIVDKAVANALMNDRNGAGSRCAYVGLDDRESPTSLNVEELALEYYRLGELPPGDDRGGWQGFHDEGSHVHSLFRIICAAPLLGAGWGCGRRTNISSCRTLHLSPYQGAPFDLLVGHEHKAERSFSFYETRQAIIEKLLDKIKHLTRQEICNLVHDSIRARLDFMASVEKRDLTSLEDASRARTLSLIAAGLGGQALAAIFRCLCFDYRHFRGGMPDLILVRASVRGDGERMLSVDLGEWIGESFTSLYQNELQARRAQMMLGDEEFLGCTMGDSGGGNTFKRNRSRPNSGSDIRNMAPGVHEMIDTMPEPLQLVFEGRPVEVETMLVEVKSANDRLDSRQHDWLNVLNLHANARVCKFVKKHDKMENP